MFFKKQYVTRNGKRYGPYQRLVESVRVPGKRTPRHRYRNEKLEPGWLRSQVQPEPGMYLGLKMQAETEKLLAAKEAPAASEGKENAPAESKGGDKGDATPAAEG